MEIKAATVSQITSYIKSGFENDELLQHLWISGEISNFKLHYSGHMYLTLKDEGAVIRAVMFRSAAARLKFKPESGMKVLSRGRITVYERDGQYQLYIDEMRPEGVGDLYVAYEQLLAKLKAEGLFDEDRKKPIPKFPQRIGVITSSTGAAVRDILNVLKRRYKLADVYVYPVLVQGEGASEQIAGAIEYFNENRAADVLVVGRGGGSIEDLWAFNEERSARAVAASEIPVISAVGHETDFTICDFAADLRAPTPSAAAELAVLSSDEVLTRIRSISASLEAQLVKSLRFNRDKLTRIAEDPRFTRFSSRIDDARIALDANIALLERAAKKVIADKSEGLSILGASLDALSPLKVLGRGYSVSIDEGGAAVRDAAALKKGEKLKLIFNRGSAECEVISVSKKQIKRKK